MTGSLQYPNAAERQDKVTSQRKECADRIEDKFNVPCYCHNVCLRVQSWTRVFCDHVFGFSCQRMEDILTCAQSSVLLVCLAYAKSVSFAPTAVHFSRTSTGILPLMGADLFDNFSNNFHSVGEAG